MRNSYISGMKKLILILAVALTGCYKEPQCLECVKGSEVLTFCDGEHSRESYILTSQGYQCRTY